MHRQLMLTTVNTDTVWSPDTKLVELNMYIYICL